MDSADRLKGLRDALWQASVEIPRSKDDPPTDPYSIPMEDLVADLATHGTLSPADEAKVLEFLGHFDPEGGGPENVELPDGWDTEIARITAALRSTGVAYDRADGAMDPGGGEHHVIRENG